MPSCPTTVNGSRQTAGPGQLTPPASARHTLPTRFKRDETTEPTPVHVTVDGDRDYLGDYPETRAGREDIPRPAATRTRKRWPFVLPPGWTLHNGDRDYLDDHPETRAGGEDVLRPAATRTRKSWPFVLPPGWTWYRRSRPTEPGQSPHDEECPP